MMAFLMPNISSRPFQGQHRNHCTFIHSFKLSPPYRPQKHLQPIISSSIQVSQPSSKTNSLFEQYNDLLKPSRASISCLASVSTILSSTASDELLFAYFLCFCVRGPRYTRYVEEWLTLAQERCYELGMREFGDAVSQRREEESGHFTKYEDDARRLCKQWNMKYPEQEVDAEALLSGELLHPGEILYRDLHVDTGSSETPFAVLIIIHEIELLAVDLLPSILGEVSIRLGPEFIKNLSFMTSHVELDTGHVEEGEMYLEKILRKYPSCLHDIVEVGKGTLHAFGRFMDDNFVMANALVSLSRKI